VYTAQYTVMEELVLGVLTISIIVRSVGYMSVMALGDVFVEISSCIFDIFSQLPNMPS